MLKSFSIALLVSIGASAAAQSSPPPTAASAATNGKDPNRIICEKEETLGTRLGGKKVCKTWLQWQEQRQEHRDSLEKIQQNVGILKSGA